VYGKKAIVFEVKNGKTRIGQIQLRNFSTAIFDPDPFAQKADELRVFFLLFTDIDTGL